MDHYLWHLTWPWYLQISCMHQGFHCRCRPISCNSFQTPMLLIFDLRRCCDMNASKQVIQITTIDWIKDRKGSTGARNGMSDQISAICSYIHSTRQTRDPFDDRKNVLSRTLLDGHCCICFLQFSILLLNRLASSSVGCDRTRHTGEEEEKSCFRR